MTEISNEDRLRDKRLAYYKAYNVKRNERKAERSGRPPNWRNQLHGYKSHKQRRRQC